MGDKGIYVEISLGEINSRNFFVCYFLFWTRVKIYNFRKLLANLQKRIHSTSEKSNTFSGPKITRMDPKIKVELELKLN